MYFLFFDMCISMVYSSGLFIERFWLEAVRVLISPSQVPYLRTWETWFYSQAWHCWDWVLFWFIPETSVSKCAPSLSCQDLRLHHHTMWLIPHFSVLCLSWKLVSDWWTLLLSMAESESCSYAGCLTANKQLDKLSSLSFKTSHSGLTMESHKVNP